MVPSWSSVNGVSPAMTVPVLGVALTSKVGGGPAVAVIVNDVRARGDAAVLDYTLRFDRLPAASVAALEIPADAMREAFAGAWYCSGEQAERELGFRPAATLAQRIQEAVDWYRAAGWLRPAMTNVEIRMSNQIRMTE